MASSGLAILVTLIITIIVLVVVRERERDFAQFGLMKKMKHILKLITNNLDMSTNVVDF
jgi:hypothetical protein